MSRTVGVVLAILLALFALSWFVLSVSFSPATSLAQEPQKDDLEAKLRQFTPQRMADRAERVHQDIEIISELADLDGTGRFDFIVAAYNIGVGGTLRVFRERTDHLEVVADLDEHVDVGGANLELELMDIDNDGKPKIKPVTPVKRAETGSAPQKGHPKWDVSTAEV